MCIRDRLYVLLPLSLVLALVGVWQGSPQTFQGYETCLLYTSLLAAGCAMADEVYADVVKRLS